MEDVGGGLGARYGAMCAVYVLCTRVCGVCTVCVEVKE